jgi:phosphodiesterase/alkaline phosphatase D-like protein
LNRSDLQSPSSGEQVPAPQQGDPTFDQITFTFNSVVVADPINVEYVVEVSTDPNFSKKNTKALGKTITPELGPVSITVSNDFFTTAGTTIWWRVGARNVADRPGPTKDAAGERFIFSAVRNFKRPSLPPPPPQAS